MTTKNLVGTALCIALGVVLPQIFHLIGAGTVFLPMHIPVLLCGFCFGPLCGLFCGVFTPFISSVITGMPPLFPTCFIMIFELATYGFVSGYCFQSKRLNIYLSLIIAMISGRIVAGALSALIYGIEGTGFGLQAFVSSYFVTALPGILLQILLIPPIVFVLRKQGIIQQS